MYIFNFCGGLVIIIQDPVFLCHDMHIKKTKVKTKKYVSKQNKMKNGVMYLR